LQRLPVEVVALSLNRDVFVGSIDNESHDHSFEPDRAS
jgi:hypothetical protein